MSERIKSGGSPAADDAMNLFSMPLYGRVSSFTLMPGFAASKAGITIPFMTGVSVTSLYAFQNVIVTGAFAAPLVAPTPMIRPLAMSAEATTEMPIFVLILPLSKCLNLIFSCTFHFPNGPRGPTPCCCSILRALTPVVPLLL